MQCSTAEFLVESIQTCRTSLVHACQNVNDAEASGAPYETIEQLQQERAKLEGKLTKWIKVLAYHEKSGNAFQTGMMYVVCWVLCSTRPI